MKKNDIFTFTAPNKVEVTAVILDIIHVGHTEGEKKMHVHYLCYAQNRLFKGSNWYGEKDGETQEWDFVPEATIVDYAILPDYDKMLEDYQHQLDVADDYASREL